MQCVGDDTALLREPWGVCSACSSPARHNPLISPCAVVLPEGTTIQMKKHIMNLGAHCKIDRAANPLLTAW